MISIGNLKSTQNLSIFRALEDVCFDFASLCYFLIFQNFQTVRGPLISIVPTSPKPPASDRGHYHGLPARPRFPPLPHVGKGLSLRVPEQKKSSPLSLLP
jgi:hypothetical protein